MEVVTKGPVATAGSILTRANNIGTKDPTKAAIDMELTTANPTEIAKKTDPVVSKNLTWATNPIRTP